MGTIHVIARGDCLSSVALRYGYFPETIWAHPSNDALRELRGDPNVLMEGDKVFLPDKEPKSTICATGKRYQFVRRGVPARFRLQLFNVDEPRANLGYKLTIDETIVHTGVTTGDGRIDVPLPPNARRGVLSIEADRTTYELLFGQLDPVNEDRGLRQRLENLGYLRRATQASEEEVAAALKMFQTHEKLEPTGVMDGDTMTKLLAAHDKKKSAPAAAV